MSVPQHDEKPQLMGGEEALTRGLQYVASAVKRSSHRECAVSVSIFKPDMTPTGSLCQDWSQCHPADPSFTSQYLTKQHRMEQIVCHARPQRDGDSQCSAVLLGHWTNWRQAMVTLTSMKNVIFPDLRASRQSLVDDGRRSRASALQVWPARWQSSLDGFTDDQILWLSWLNDGHEYMVDYMFDLKKCLVLLYGPVS